MLYTVMVAIAHREPWKGHCVHAPGAEGGHECLYSVQWPYGSMEKVILYMLQVQKLAMNVCTLYRGRAVGHCVHAPGAEGGH